MIDWISVKLLGITFSGGYLAVITGNKWVIGFTIAAAVSTLLYNILRGYFLVKNKKED